MNKYQIRVPIFELFKAGLYLKQYGIEIANYTNQLDEQQVIIMTEPTTRDAINNMLDDGNDPDSLIWSVSQISSDSKYGRIIFKRCKVRIC